MPGPIPKRTDERLGHRSKAERAAVDRGEGAPEVQQPPPDENWCELARDLWRDLGASGFARFYEPGDWAELRLTMWFITTKVDAGRMSGQDLAAVHSMLSDHLVSDGARRRLRLELQRPQPKQDAELPTNVTDIESRRSALA